MENIFNESTSKMSKAIDNLKNEFSRLRTGRATPSLLEGIRIEYYGALTPINQVGNISVPEPKLLLIQPWDTTSISAIEKAIIKSELGLNPQSDGKLIRIPIPALTDERRKDLIKHIKKMGEESKIAVRNIRRQANDETKALEKSKEISEDDLKKANDKIQKITDEFIKNIDSVISLKEKEISQG